jgi:hypothetical protein
MSPNLIVMSKRVIETYFNGLSIVEEWKKTEA